MSKDEDFVSYCGLYCRDCVFLKGEIANLAKGLMGKLRESDFERIALGLYNLLEEYKGLKNYKQFYEILDSLSNLKCEKICRNGGGSIDCQIRICCQDKNLVGCWECQEFENCANLERIKPVNQDANLKNLRKIKEEGIDSFLKGTKYW